MGVVNNNKNKDAIKDLLIDETSFELNASTFIVVHSLHERSLHCSN
jgi:hypothetical protein